MSRLQINNGAEVVGAIYYDQQEEELVIESFGVKQIRLSSFKLPTEQPTNLADGVIWIEV